MILLSVTKIIQMKQDPFHEGLAFPGKFTGLVPVTGEFEIFKGDNAIPHNAEGGLDEVLANNCNYLTGTKHLTP